jgi:hypothetical protein
MSFVRFLMLLSLVVWIGGITFFAFVVAPTVFRPEILPTHQLAGNVVSRSLMLLHILGISCGLVFVATSMISAAVVNGSAEPFALRHVLVYLMILLTLVSMFGVGARMEALKKDMAMIDSVPKDDPRRVEFNSLHVWSTRLEGTVLLLGLAVIFLTARRMT